LTQKKSKDSDAQRSRQKDFGEKLGKLFDIAYKDADKILKINEDRIFLEDQRTARKMKMSDVDTELTEMEERSAQRRQAQEERKRREGIRKQECVSVASSSQHCVSPQHSNEDSDTEQHSDSEVEIPVCSKKQMSEAESDESVGQTSESKKPRFLPDMLSSPEVSSVQTVLDRINLSDRKFTTLAAATAKAG